MRLRFKVIHILILVTFVGCLCAWFLPTLSRRHAVINVIDNADGVSIGRCSRSPLWSDAIGIRSFDEVDGLIFVDGSVSTDLLVGLHDLTGLTTIGFFSVELQDDELRAIGQLTSLRHLRLCDCSISDADLSHLQSLNHLETLDLSGNDITDCTF
ncbi:MAG: leucine-rich repeat domain-containing protein [Pirellulaceae bacterium]